MNVCEKNMNGVTDRKICSEIMSRLKVIRNNVKKYYPEDEQNYQEEAGENMNKEKKTLISISHSSKNKEQVKLIVE